MAASQKQIAEKLGVSIALVSRVLSGKAEEIGIAPETIERVSQMAEEMGYVPSAAALTLKGKATRTIGVAVYDFNDPFFGALIKQIQIQANEHNYSLILAGFLRRVPDEQDLLALHKHAIEGLVVLGTDMNAQWLDAFRHLPVARIGHGSDTEQSVRISVDEEDAARQLVEYLDQQGKRSLSCISGPLSAHRLRHQALERAAAVAGLHFTLIETTENDPFLAGLASTRKLLGGNTQIDALVCATDLIAMGALHALAGAGIDVPGRVAVTGFDDIPSAAQFIPPLTTIHQPFEKMVQKAFKSIIEPTAPQAIPLSGELVVRETA